MHLLYCNIILKDFKRKNLLNALQYVFELLNEHIYAKFYFNHLKGNIFYWFQCREQNLVELFWSVFKFVNSKVK